MKNLLTAVLITLLITAGCGNPFTPPPPDLTEYAGTWQMAGLSTGTYERIYRESVDDPWIIDMIDASVADRAIWVIDPDAITILYGEPGMEDVPPITATCTVAGDTLNVAYTHTFEWTYNDALITESYAYALSCDLSGDLAGALEFAGTVQYEATYEPEMFSKNTGGELEFEGVLYLAI